LSKLANDALMLYGSKLVEKSYLSICPNSQLGLFCTLRTALERLLENATGRNVICKTLFELFCIVGNYYKSPLRKDKSINEIL